MKRSKLMAGIIAASIALLGTGYAYWSDALTVTTSVSTGELKVQYTTAGITQGELNEVKTQDANLGSSSSSTTSEIMYANGQAVEDIKNSLVDGQSIASGKVVYYNRGNNKTKNVASDYQLQNIESWAYLDTNGNFTRNPHNNQQAYWYQITTTTEGTDPSPAQYGETIVTDATANGALGAAGYIKEGTAVVSSDAKGVAITIKNMYPGSFATATFTAENAGTIPAVLDTVKLDSTIDALGSALKVIALESGETLTDEMIASASSLTNIASVVEEAYTGTKLEPKSATADQESVTMTLVFIMPGSVTEYQDKTMTDVGLTINWGQHNQLKTSEKTTVTE